MFHVRTHGASALSIRAGCDVLAALGLGFVMRRRLELGWSGVSVVALAAGLALPLAAAHADTLESALIQAYQNNPTLNSQRASVRATRCS